MYPFEPISLDSPPGIYIPLQGEYWIQIVSSTHWVKHPTNETTTHTTPVQRSRKLSPIEGVYAYCLFPMFYEEIPPPQPKRFKHSNGRVYFIPPKYVEEMAISHY
jgi:hypothetical protein